MDSRKKTAAAILSDIAAEVEALAAEADTEISDSPEVFEDLNRGKVLEGLAAARFMCGQVKSALADMALAAEDTGLETLVKAAKVEALTGLVVEGFKDLLAAKA